MKALTFTKMHGIGNDYIYFDCEKEVIENPKSLAKKLCDRHFSVGGDGIVLILKSTVADCKMRMFNLDGSEGKMCGNAIRCVGKYLHDRKEIKKDTITVDTLSGIKTLKMEIKNGIAVGATVDMGSVSLKNSDIPALLPGDETINKAISVGDRDYFITLVSVGNPHCVIFSKNIENLDLDKIGPEFENNPLFPQRINTEFVEILNENLLKMRVYERGSGETLACGTGACATAVAAVKCGICKADTPIKILLKGGRLSVTYTKENHVFLHGSAEFAFEGRVEI